MRKLLTDDVVVAVATLLARSSRSEARFFLAVCYLVVIRGRGESGRWMSDVAKDKIVHEGTFD